MYNLKTLSKINTNLCLKDLRDLVPENNKMMIIDDYMTNTGKKLKLIKELSKLSFFQDVT